MRFGLIGFGAWGKQHAQAIASLPGLELVAIARYTGNVNWSAPAAWVYLAFLLSVLPVGLLTLFQPRWVEKR